MLFRLHGYKLDNEMVWLGEKLSRDESKISFGLHTPDVELLAISEG